MKKLEFMVVMDLFMTDTAKLADIVLPACSFLEKSGVGYVYGVTLVNRMHCFGRKSSNRLVRAGRTGNMDRTRQKNGI
jgi:hypothetical protein